MNVQTTKKQQCSVVWEISFLPPSVHRFSFECLCDMRWSCTQIKHIGAKYGFSISEQRNRNTWLNSSVGIIRTQTGFSQRDQMYVMPTTPMMTERKRDKSVQQKMIIKVKLVGQMYLDIALLPLRTHLQLLIFTTAYVCVRQVIYISQLVSRGILHLSATKATIITA